MMKLRSLQLVATAVLVSLAVVGCASSPQATNVVVRAWGSEPQSPLIPASTSEVGGGKIVDAIFAGLTSYNSDGSVQTDVAQSIATDDARHYEIVLHTDRRFSNGERVTAASFVDAWNFAALASNAQVARSYFSAIEGFTEEHDSRLTGLRIIDQFTFTVTLKSEMADFPNRLAYSAFYPMPTSAFDDIEAYGRHPVGNGPYLLASSADWKHQESIMLQRNERYIGAREPANDGLMFVFYENLESAYSGLLSGDLDVLEAIPDSAVPTYKADLGKRAVNLPAALNFSLVLPVDMDHFRDDEGALRRRALSRAIDRDQITQMLFGGTRTPAVDFTSPATAGWTEHLIGAEVLTHDPIDAVALWSQANEIAEWDGVFEIAYNADGGHAAWVDAVRNQLTSTLGIETTGTAYPSLGALRAAITAGSIDTAFRSGRQGDRGVEFLEPIFSSTSHSNDSGYANPEVDGILLDIRSETDPDAVALLLQECQELLLRDLPVIPLWYQNTTGGYSAAVSDVAFGWNSIPIYHDIRVVAR